MPIIISTGTINPNISKLFARIMLNRLMKVVESGKLLGEFQGATRPGRHTSDNIFILSVIIEKARANKMKGTSAAFIDMRKAYDMVDREKLWAVLQEKGINGTFLELLKSMYEDSEIWVDINGSRTQDPVKPARGLKQGCVLSPILFSLYMNDLGRILQETNLGIEIGDTNISCLMFADDI